MSYDRLAETTHTLYAELLDQLVSAEAEDRLAATGSFVSKQIGSARYWYTQRVEDGMRRQLYLGRETPELLAQIERRQSRRSELRSDERRRRELVAMLTSGGMTRESAAATQVLRILYDAGAFRMGAVLVGTLAFSAIGSLLGVRTVGIDVADDCVHVAVEKARSFAVPGFDVRESSTFFKIRGRDLRVDFLVPARTARLDYLIEETTKAAILGGSGVLVSIPLPARFAMHKLWVSRERPASELAKSRKDLRQAGQIFEVLLDDDPHQIEQAWRALPAGRMAKQVRQALDSLGPVGERVLALE